MGERSGGARAGPKSEAEPEPAVGNGRAAPRADRAAPARPACAGGNAAPLPASVRGAPPELRRAIRKRQNSESARRCRERRKGESAQAAAERTQTAARLRALEAAVATLDARVAHISAVAAAVTAARAPPPQRPAAAQYARPPHAPDQVAEHTRQLQIALAHAAAPGQPPSDGTLNGPPWH